MPEHLKALVVVLGIAIPVFWLASRPVAALSNTPAEFFRRRNLWFTVTLLAFLAHSFWIYAIVVGALLAIRAPRDPNPLALYCMLLFAVPPFDITVPGFGPIDNFFALNHIRVLNLAILLPFAYRLFQNPINRELGARTPDVFIASFLLLMLVSQSIGSSATHVLRTAFYLMLDIWLPYYVASRSFRNMSDFRELASTFSVVTALLALIAIFETSRYWLVYESLRIPMGFPPPTLATYLQRGADGLLRANASAAHPIVLGYIIMIGLGMTIFMAPRIQPRWKLRVAVLCLLGGLIAPMSRGPWVGAGAMLLLIFCLGPGRHKRLAWLVGGGGIAVVALLLSPLGSTVVDYLPFVGSVEAGNVEYRQRLFNVSVTVIAQNPWFGDLDFLRNPVMEQMRQGQGIIDIVNTYLDVGLRYGLVGLGLFFAPFVIAMHAVWSVRRAAQTDTELERLGRVLLATMVGILVTIATSSSISFIPTVYWLVLGLCICYARQFGDLARSRRLGIAARPESAARVR